MNIEHSTETRSVGLREAMKVLGAGILLILIGTFFIAVGEHPTAWKLLRWLGVLLLVLSPVMLWGREGSCPHCGKTISCGGRQKLVICRHCKQEVTIREHRLFLHRSSTTPQSPDSPWASPL